MNADAAPRLRVDLLGPVRASVDDRPIDVGPPRQQALLAFLAMRANQVVARDLLIDALWATNPPPSATNGVHGYIAALRRACEPDRAPRASSRVLVGAAGGYLLRLLPGQLDSEEFQTLLAEAQRITGDDPAGAVRVLDSALRLWRGAALAGVTGPVVEAERVRLSELRLVAVEERAEAMLRLGQHRRIVAELSAVTAEQPLRERVRLLLMTALYHDGRQAEALALYADTRRLFAQELGVEPGLLLRQLHQHILTRQGTQHRTAYGTQHGGPYGTAYGGPADSPQGTRRSAVPHQLPPPVAYLAGRDTELSVLTRLADEAVDQPAMVIAVIDGTAGVGKTTLAVTWAHRIAGRFGDGQLYLNLRGFGPTGSAMGPAEAVRGLLDGLGVAAQEIPASLDAQVALYRSRLAGTRTLVVLDNAADAAQVRTLLPGSPGCLVVVTSRNRLTGLLAVEGGHEVTLGLLDDGEARELLRHRIGQRRLDDEPDAVTEIVTRCARLPLALAVVAARAGTRTTPTLASLAAELRGTAEVFDALDSGDAAADVRTVFSWSYDRLTPDAARVFRMFGLHPGPAVTLAALASLAGLPIPAVRRILVELTRAHLVAETGPGRYACHDLLRAYAAERTGADDTEAVRRDATRRMVDHYLHTAHHGTELLKRRAPIVLDPPAPGVVTGRFADRGEALAWFLAEHAALMAVLAGAAQAGLDRAAWQLAWGLNTYLDIQGHWQDWVRVGTVALAAAVRLADLPVQAQVRNNLARAYAMLGCHQEAQAHIGQAIDTFASLGDAIGQARTHISFCMVLERQGRHRDALHHAEESLALFGTTGDRRGHAFALNAAGWCHAQLGQYEQALRYCDQARVLHEQAGDQYSAAEAWDSLGYAHHHLGDHDQAIACYHHALDVFRAVGDRFNEAEVLTHLGDSNRAVGNTGGARRAWQDALDILDDLAHSRAERVRARLTETELPETELAETDLAESDLAGTDLAKPQRKIRPASEAAPRLDPQDA